MSKYTAWGSGSWSLSNTGDELVVLRPADQILDSVAYRNGDYTILALEPDASAPEPHSLQRVWSTNTNSIPPQAVRISGIRSARLTTARGLVRGQPCD